jgi:hypothetical protein
MYGITKPATLLLFFTFFSNNDPSTTITISHGHFFHIHIIDIHSPHSFCHPYIYSVYPAHSLGGVVLCFTLCQRACSFTGHERTFQRAPQARQRARSFTGCQRWSVRSQRQSQPCSFTPFSSWRQGEHVGTWQHARDHVRRALLAEHSGFSIFSCFGSLFSDKGFQGLIYFRFSSVLSFHLLG